MSFFIIIQIILLDVIAVWGIKKIFPQFSARHRKNIHKAFIIQAAVAVLIVLIGQILQRQVRDYRLVTLYYYVFAVVTTVYLPKAFYVMCLLIDCFVIAGLTRNLLKIRTVFVRDSRFRGNDGAYKIVSRNRRHIVAKAGLFASFGLVCLVIWGILFGRFNFTVEQADVVIDDLPPAFNGYKIVQIADVHAGSFAGCTHRFQKAVDLINMQNPDFIVFTGDMVNNFAEELAPLIPIFSQLNARDGKYAVLGNHDYGGYCNWKTPADSIANHKAIKNGIEQMGFVLLNNQSVILPSPFSPPSPLSPTFPDHIALIGIENWGVQKKRPKHGNLEKAIKQVRDIPVKILLSHDPSFWREHVKGKTDIALTLSGHSHGMQMGIKLGEKRFSPASLLRHRYHHGVGLYRSGSQHLYINRGLGVIGFSGRIGMPPEITVITLKKPD